MRHVSSCGAWAQQLCLSGSRAQAQCGLSSCDSRAPEHRLSAGSAFVPPGLQSTGSVAAAPGLSRCVSRAPEHRLSADSAFVSPGL